MQSMLNERLNLQKQRERETDTDEEEEEVGVIRKAVSSTVMWFSISHLIGVTWQRWAGLQQGLPQ